MAKKLWSALTDDLDHCIVCGRSPAQLHHIFYGISTNRKHAEEDGYIIPLCYAHHTQGRDAIHLNGRMAHEWMEMAQEHYELTHTREEFRIRYGKNYLWRKQSGERETGTEAVSVTPLPAERRLNDTEGNDQEPPAGE